MKKRFTIAVVSLLVACALLLVPLLGVPVLAVDSYPLQTSDSEVADALDYLRAQQDTDGSIGTFGDSAWVVMAIAAADEDPHDWQVGGTSIVDYLAANAGDAALSTDYARMLLAIAAADEDPADFGDKDFVSLLEATYDDTTEQIGDATALNDDIFGIMGLIAAGRSPSSEIVTDAVAFVLSNQNGGGGWGWTVGSASDVDMTAAAIMALIAAGESEISTAITNALAYIKSTQQENGGFLSWGSTNADTDSWAIGGIVAAGEDPTDPAWTSEAGNTPVDDLLTCQQGDGQFYFQDGTPGAWPLRTTAYAITALLAEPYPVAVLEPLPEEGVTIDVRVEGQSQNIWSGSVPVTESWITATNSGDTYHLEGPTAMGALDEASQAGDFPYETTDEWGTLFITSINGEEGSATSAWMYMVDYVGPGAGADNFILNETTPPDPPHQEVLFYYVYDSNWGALPLKIEVDNVNPDVGESFTATVTQYIDGTPLPCEGATVHADQNYTTDQDGVVDITVDSDMTLNIYAGKNSFIRSNRVTVTVGTGIGASSDVGLVAKIIPAISFTVNPSSINFGELGPRDISEPHTITITNTGAWDLLITCTVTDEAEDLYVEGLKLDGEMWNLFSEVTERDDASGCVATLTVPENYTHIGEQTGTIIFWAEEAS